MLTIFCLQSYKTYFIFATFNAAGFIHVLFMYPETKGRTLEEIDEVFDQGHVFAAWKVKNSGSTKTLAEVKAGAHHNQHGSDEKIAPEHEDLPTKQHV